MKGVRVGWQRFGYYLPTSASQLCLLGIVAQFAGEPVYRFTINPSPTATNFFSSTTCPRPGISDPAFMGTTMYVDVD